MCLNVCTVARALQQIPNFLNAKRNTHPECKTHTLWSTNHTPNFSTICLAVPEIRKWVRTCCCAPFFFCKKSLANGLQTTHQISAQSVQPLTRYGKGDTSACTHVQLNPTHDLRNTHRCLASKHTPNLVSAEPFLSYSLAANFDTLPAACVTCQGNVPQMSLPQMSQIRL